jgi:GntR family transcriptional regulator
MTTPVPTISDVPEPREPVPPYLRISGEIRGQIERGELLPGEQVPSIVKLGEQYGISRGTARRVLLQLQEWGLVEITPGWGSFVKGRE